MDIVVENPDHVESVDIIVGIPSYNEADSIAYPTDVASRGLVEYFPDKKSVIINVDNNSPDGTMDAFMNTNLFLNCQHQNRKRWKQVFHAAFSHSI